MSNGDASAMPFTWQDKAIELAKEGYSWRKVAELVDKPRTTVSDFLRKTFKAVKKDSAKSCNTFAVRKVDDKNEDNSRILLISDMHIPYHHPDLIPFLTHLKEKYKPTRVICMGDEVDHNALSYHEKDPDMPGAGDELRQALPVIKELKNLFPKMDILESNHGSLVWRKAKTHGIPRHYIKSYNEVLGVDDGWKWSFDLTVRLPNGQLCYLHHGKSSDPIKLSQQMGLSAAQGHFHNGFKIDYWGNPNGLFWAMQCGCLVDDDALAFSYNNVNIRRPVIGTGLIIDSIPVLEPMILNEGGRWEML